MLRVTLHLQARFLGPKNCRPPQAERASQPQVQHQNAPKKANANKKKGHQKDD